MKRDYTSALLGAQQAVIEKIALGAPLQHTLNEICNQIEGILDDVHAFSSILVKVDNTLRHGAAPSLPKAYCDSIDGVVIGPKVGSCGTAVFERKRIIVADIASNLLWEDYKDLALEHELRSCWSTPILSSTDEVLGSFAIYYSYANTPSPEQLRIIDRFTHLSGLAIEKEKLAQHQQKTSRELARATHNLQAISEVLPDICLILDERGYYVDLYGGDEELLITPFEKLKGRHLSEILPSPNANLMIDVISRVIETGQMQVLEYELEVMAGTCIFEGRVTLLEDFVASDPNRKHVMWMAREITQRRMAERQVEQLAFYDPLTTLPNRRLLQNRLKKVIDDVQRHDNYGALFYFDLDDFKRINDSLGHSIGDKLLVKVAERLRPLVRAADTLARIGGDEFAIIPDLFESDRDVVMNEAIAIAHKINQAFAVPFSLEDKDFKISCSIGICLVEQHSISPDTVLKKADTAMYRAKALGGDRFAFFEEALQLAADQRLQIESEILKAIEERQFLPYFQPQLDTEGRLIGAEALMRWQHPERGMIAPFHFIPVAEQGGFIHDLQCLMLDDVCKVLNQLDERRSESTPVRMAINLSASQFRNRSLTTDLLEILNRNGISPERIKLEITESTLMDQVEDTIEEMHRLREHGFKFSIDDFGTGYSSLAYLQSFPIDELKVDKFFVDRLKDEDQGCVIVDAIIAMAKQLRLQVIAEGIEYPEQEALLTERGVDGLQGYLFARPMPAADFLRWSSEQTAQVSG